MVFDFFKSVGVNQTGGNLSRHVADDKKKKWALDSPILNDIEVETYTKYIILDNPLVRMNSKKYIALRAINYALIENKETSITGHGSISD